jgi:hypothetical protein
VAGQVFKYGELRLLLVHTLLKDIDAGFGSYTYVAVIEAYAARRFP